jgi:hypothetical protein
MMPQAALEMVDLTGDADEVVQSNNPVEYIKSCFPVETGHGLLGETKVGLVALTIHGKVKNSAHISSMITHLFCASWLSSWRGWMVV